jgi:hypothetical protein
MTQPRIFSFATMMVLAQRRHAVRLATPAAPLPQQALQREAAARRTLQKMNGTKRLLVFMYSA